MRSFSGKQNCGNKSFCAAAEIAAKFCKYFIEWLRSRENKSGAALL
jgi:hypothetical protein